jgi:hypothetical protein
MGCPLVKVEAAPTLEQTVPDFDPAISRGLGLPTNDPNGTLVEFCCTTRRCPETDVEEAQRFVAMAEPPLADPPPFEIHEASKR